MGSPLAIHHEKLGAVLEGGRVPVQFTDPVQEYWTLKRGAGMIDLSYQGRLSITGKDRISFLNGLLTNDLTTLKDDGGAHALLLNARARVLADLYIYKLDDSLIVDTGDSPAHQVKIILDGFIITEDVQIQDSGEEQLLISLQGPLATEALKGVLGVDASGLQSLFHRKLGPSLVISRDRTGLGGYDIIVPRDESEVVWNSLLLRSAGFGLGPVGSKALEIFRLEKGLPKYGVDVDENTIVLEAGYKDAISYTKGCYMGQEVVARATHIGRVNRRLVQLHMDTQNPPSPKSKVTSEGREAGHVTSAAFSPGMSKVVGLAYVQRDFTVEGTKVTVDAEAGLVSATVTRIV